MDETTLFDPFLMLLIMMICAFGVGGVLLYRFIFKIPQVNSEQNSEFTLTSFANNEDNNMDTETTVV